MAVQSYKAQIEFKNEIAHNTFLMRIKMPAGMSINFQPGQFVTISVAPNIRRSYSIASSSAHFDYIDLIADTNLGGPGSQFFANTQAGAMVDFIGPLGIFVYKQSLKPTYFFSTGTGVVPFMSMVEYALDSIHEQKELKIFSGFRFEQDIFGRDLFERLASKYPNFKYLLSVSKPSPNWQGRAGRINVFYPEELKNPDIDAYICGSQKSIEGIKTDLIALHVPESQIYYEKFY